MNIKSSSNRRKYRKRTRKQRSDSSSGSGNIILQSDVNWTDMNLIRELIRWVTWINFFTSYRAGNTGVYNEI